MPWLSGPLPATGDAVGSEDLRAQDLRRQVAHAARRDVRQQITERHVPGVARSGVLDVEGEVAPLSYI